MSDLGCGRISQEEIIDNCVALVERLKGEAERLKEEHRELVEALEELTKAEWMVTHDWGGDREVILDQARAILEKVRKC